MAGTFGVGAVVSAYGSERALVMLTWVARVGHTAPAGEVPVVLALVALGTPPPGATPANSARLVARLTYGSHFVALASCP